MTSTHPIPTITEGIAALLKRILNGKPDVGDDGKFWISPGTGTRVANAAADLGLVKQWTRDGKPVLRGGDLLLPIRETATQALRKYERATLPQGVEAGPDNVIGHYGKRIGRLSRSGAKRGQLVAWRGLFEKDGAETEVADFAGDMARIMAIRAVCKAAGIPLPGEETVDDVAV